MHTSRHGHALLQVEDDLLQLHDAIVRDERTLLQDVLRQEVRIDALVEVLQVDSETKLSFPTYSML